MLLLRLCAFVSWITFICTVIFFTLKLTSVIGWSWWVVLSPTTITILCHLISWIVVQKVKSQRASAMIEAIHRGQTK